MKKVGVMTLFHAYTWDNYGGTLQNYALVYTLRKLGMEAYTIAPLYRESKYVLYDIISRFVYHKYGIWLEREGRRITPRYIGIQKKRNEAFGKFVRKYIPIKYYRILDDLVYEKIEKQYDFFVVGSDQVWNTYFAVDDNTYKNLLLTYAPTKKRIAYAASFGTETVNPKWKAKLEEELVKFKAISVRENSGKEIVRALTGSVPEELVDPTLLVTVEEWKMVEKKPSFLSGEEEYLLTYFLGKKTEETEEKIRNIAQINNLKVYNLLEKENQNIFSLGPGEFIYMIEHAKIVLTDSFHACVFSFLFEKPFLVFSRIDTLQSMESRIDSLLTKFNLQKKKNGEDNIEQLFECDYSSGKQVLETERKRSMEYLLRNIN